MASAVIEPEGRVNRVHIEGLVRRNECWIAIGGLLPKLHHLSSFLFPLYVSSSLCAGLDENYQTLS
jgi:hypothetical protein